MCRFTSDRCGAGGPSPRAPAICLIAFCAPMALPPGPGGDLGECRIAAIVASPRAFSSAAVARFTAHFGPPAPAGEPCRGIVAGAQHPSMH